MRLRSKSAFVLLCLASLLSSCNKQNTIQEEMKALEENGCFFLNKTLEYVKGKIGSWKFYDIYGDEPKKIGMFEYSKKIGTTDVYTCGTFNGQETRFYFRDNVNVGFSTRDPQFGFSLFGKTIGGPTYGMDGEWWDNSIVGKFDSRGYEFDAVRHEEPSELSILDINEPLNCAYRYMTYKEKLHVNFGRECINSFCNSMLAMEVYLDEQSKVMKSNVLINE